MSHIGQWIKRQFANHFNTRNVGLALLLFGLFWGFLGYEPGMFIEAFSANLATELISIAITVLIIDYLNDQRQDEQHKGQLIREMGASDNGIARRAVRELRALGWIEDGSLNGAELSGANLQKANLLGANLQSVVLEGADLQEADLRSANLGSANLGRTNLRKAVLWSTLLQKTDLKGASLQGASLVEANLQGAGLMYANLREADLIEANLYLANLRRADLRGADLSRANLQEADLGYVDLRGADLEGADFQGANLALTNLQGVVTYTVEQLLKAKSLEGAIMPDGLAYQEWIRKIHSKDGEQ